MSKSSPKLSSPKPSCCTNMLFGLSAIAVVAAISSAVEAVYVDAKQEGGRGRAVTYGLSAAILVPVAGVMFGAAKYSMGNDKAQYRENDKAQYREKVPLLPEQTTV